MTPFSLSAMAEVTYNTDLELSVSFNVSSLGRGPRLNLDRGFRTFISDYGKEQIRESSIKLCPRPALATCELGNPCPLIAGHCFISDSISKDLGYTLISL